MSLARLLVLGSVLSCPLYVLGQSTAFTHNLKSVSVHAKILARSTSVRQIFAGNEDVYLADILVNGQHKMAKLVDSYPDAGSPVRSDLLADLHPLRMKLVRDFECDVKGSTFFLGRDSLIFDPAVRDDLNSHASEIIPCYRVDHDATRLAK